MPCKKPPVNARMPASVSASSLPGIYNLQTIFCSSASSGPKRCNLRSSIYRELRNREMGRSDQAQKARDNKRKYPLRMVGHVVMLFQITKSLYILLSSCTKQNLINEDNGTFHGSIDLIACTDGKNIIGSPISRRRAQLELSVLLSKGTKMYQGKYFSNLVLHGVKVNAYCRTAFLACGPIQSHSTEIG